LLFLAISTILISSPLIGNAFAADKPTKLQKECTKEFEKKDPLKYSKECELLSLINENQPNPQADSFFDVFFDVFTVDSFFDIFTELQTTNDAQQSQIDSFFDIFTELQASDESQQSQIDSFFDIFTELQAADTQLQSNIDNEATSRATADALLQTRVNENCPVGSSIRQINSDGSVLCEPDDVGTGSGGRLIVVERSGQTTDFSAETPFRSSYAPCLSGEMVVGGGYRTTDPRVNISGESSTIFEGLPAWSVNAYSPSGEGSITALAECARIEP